MVRTTRVAVFKRPHAPICSLALVLGMAAIGFAQRAILPPVFVKPVRSVYSIRDDIRFPVRVVPHPDLRLLRASLWPCEEVQQEFTFPFEGSTEVLPDIIPVKCERTGHPIRESDEPLETYPPFDGDETHQQWRTRVQPRTLYEFWWRSGLVQSGTYELVIAVRTNRGIVASTPLRIEVR